MISFHSFQINIPHQCPLCRVDLFDREDMFDCYLYCPDCPIQFMMFYDKKNNKRAVEVIKFFVAPFRIEWHDPGQIFIDRRGPSFKETVFIRNNVDFDFTSIESLQQKIKTLAMFA